MQKQRSLFSLQLGLPNHLEDYQVKDLLGVGLEAEGALGLLGYFPDELFRLLIDYFVEVF